MSSWSRTRPASAPRAAASRPRTPSKRASHGREEQFVSGIGHDRMAVAPDADGSAEPYPGAADDARDVRAAVEQRGELAGPVGYLAGQDRVPLDWLDLHHADPALHAG